MMFPVINILSSLARQMTKIHSSNSYQDIFMEGSYKQIEGYSLVKEIGRGGMALFGKQKRMVGLMQSKCVLVLMKIVNVDFCENLD